MENKRERIRKILDDLTTDEYVEMNNLVCENEGYAEHIYSMSEFDEIVGSFVRAKEWSVSETTRWATWNKVDMNDGYFVIDSNENITTSDNPFSLGLDTSDILNYIMNNEDDLGNWDIEEILWEDEADDEEEEDDEGEKNE